MTKTAKAFAALGHETRLKIVECVLIHSPATLQYIQAITQKETANISHHLKILTEAGLIRRHQSGPFAMFTFNEPVISSLILYLGRVLEKVKKDHEALDSKVPDAGSENPSVRPTGDGEDGTRDESR
jgi:DNA-binding transcriptional ArsR family regulator